MVRSKTTAGKVFDARKTEQQPCSRSFGSLVQSLASGLPTDCSKPNAVVNRRDVVLQPGSDCFSYVITYVFKSPVT